VEEPLARSLSALRPGERGILVRVSDADPEILRQLTRLGIALGQEVEVLAEREAAGTLAVRVAGVTHVLAVSVVAAMQVEVDGEA
jgi:DtxR family Mn-dependent transcriptional regulator